MKSLYTSPLRVYLLLGFLALVGIFSGLKLPVSLFPNSTKPEIHVNISYGGSTSQEFLNTFGNNLETQLSNLSTPKLEIEKLTADYGPQSVSYDLEFKWGTSPQEALKEVQITVTGFAAQFPREIRDSVSVDTWSGNGGFLAISFYSSTRSLDDLHQYLEPLIAPKLAHIQDTANAGIWNPEQKEIQIDMDAEKMAALQLVPSDVRDAVTAALSGGGGGVIKEGPNTLDIMMNRQAKSIDDLNLTLVKTPNGRVVHLSEVAHIDLALPVTNSESFKTSGEASLILFADPKPGGNVKRMAEDIIRAVRDLEPTLPKDIHYKILVDPSEFIRAAITNVFHEVVLAALLAVGVLFLFIGNLKNVVTAAIEIPMSIVLAFILMRITGINLNLISLGGLALSAGMNVDASVVVMENIFRHFEEVRGVTTFQQRLQIVCDAVSEVKFPVIASTIASLVVFLPLAFTSGLSNALLSDLALAVVFSHGFSAMVALILVPTIRLQLLSVGGQTHSASPIEKPLRHLETFYVSSLNYFINQVSIKRFAYSGLTVLLVALLTLVLPHLKKEIVGMPDTDWLLIRAYTDENTMVRQMEEKMGEVEVNLLAKYGDVISYTFTQVNGPNSGFVMARLKNKKQMQKLLEAMQTFFANTPTLKYSVKPWNPSEFKIPDPPEVKISIRGGTPKQRTLTARELKELVDDSKLYSDVATEPNVHRKESVTILPHFEQWALLSNANSHITAHDLSEMARLATSSQKIGSLSYEGQIFPIILEYQQGRVKTIEDLGAIPLGVAGKLVPLKALAEIRTEELGPPIYRENQNELIILTGKLNKGEESRAKTSETQFNKLVNDFKDSHRTDQTISINFEDAKRDLNDALRQLGSAVALSILLIFLTMVLQFGDVVNALLVLVAVPLGFIGVLTSLFIFQSTLSLNSVLGVILLNGIAVANSIILVDFLKRLVDGGLAPRAAALQAAQKRLRPILMTSLTTALGMLPIALGFGEGGRILQPLGIAVIGGLGFSGLTTLFVVPALQVSYLEWRLRKNDRPRSPLARHLGDNPHDRAIVEAPVGQNFMSSIIPAFLPLAVGVALLALPFQSACAAIADPVPAHNRAVSFEEAVQTILHRSTDIDIQKTKVSSAEFTLTQRKTNFLPTVGLVGQQNTVNPPQPSTTSTTYTATAALNLFRAGADMSSLYASQKDLASSESFLDLTLLTTEELAVEAVAIQIEKQMSVEVLAKQVAQFRSYVKIAQERYARGLLASQEVDKIIVDMQNLEAHQRDFQSQLVTAQAAVARLLGHSEIDAQWPWKSRAVSPAFKNVVDSKFPLEERPDYKAALAALEAENKRINQKYELMLPTLDVSFSYSYPQTWAQNPTGTTLLTLTAPLFEDLAQYTPYKIQQQTAYAAEARLRQIQRDALSDWQANHDNFQVALDTALSRDKTLSLSQKLYESSYARFRQGRASANDLQVDESRLTDAETLAIQGWSALHSALSKLCHSLGRSVFKCERH